MRVRRSWVIPALGLGVVALIAAGGAAASLFVQDAAKAFEDTERRIDLEILRRLTDIQQRLDMLEVRTEALPTDEDPSQLSSPPLPSRGEELC